MGEVRIKVVRTEEELINSWDLLKEVPLVNIPHRVLLSKCLMGKADMIFGVEDGVNLGMAIVEVNQYGNLEILAVNAKNNTHKLINAFYHWAKEQGINKIIMQSTFDRKAYCRLLGVKFITAIYEKDLTKWQ